MTFLKTVIRKLDRFENLVNKIKEGVPPPSQDLTRDSSREELHLDMRAPKPQKLEPRAGKKDSILARLMSKKHAVELPALTKKVPQIVNAKLDRELRREYNVFVKSVEDLNDRLAYKVFENLALGSTQEKRILSLHLRRKSNDEKKHWLRPLQRRSLSVEQLPKVESREQPG